jgi:uncharacterized Tic20 family protein
MMKRIGILLVVLGVLMLGGALASFGYSIYHAVNAGEALRASVTPAEPYISPLLQVDTTEHVQLALEFDVRTTSVQEEREAGGKSYTARYNFPVSYQVLDENNHLLHEQRCNAAWDGCGLRSLSNEQLDQRGGTVTVEHGFDKFRVKPPGRILVKLLVEPDPSYGATARHIDLVVYDKVITHATNIGAGIALMFFAPIVLIVGILLMVVPVNGARQALATDISSDIRTWAMFTHLSALLAYIGVPFGHIVGPLIIWLVKKDDDPFINSHGRESLNFQLSITLYTGIAFLLMFAIVGFVLLPVVLGMHVVLCILAALRANDGQLYRYPLTIRFL